jgi:hypothetical protein
MPLFSARQHHLGAAPERWQQGPAHRACTGSPVRCLACNWAQSTGPIPDDGSARGYQPHLWTVGDPAKADQAGGRPYDYASAGQCCVGRSQRAGDWLGDVVGEILSVCWLQVSAGGYRGGGPLIPALRPVLPRRRGTAGRARHHRRPRHHLPMGAAVRGGVHRGRPAVPSRSR